MGSRSGWGPDWRGHTALALALVAWLAVVPIGRVWQGIAGVADERGFARMGAMALSLGWSMAAALPACAAAVLLHLRERRTARRDVPYATTIGLLGVPWLAAGCIGLFAALLFLFQFLR